MADLRYPIGEFRKPVTVTDRDRDRFIDDIAAAPDALRAAVAGLDETQLDTAYRPGGWAVRQVVHHLPDSHLNAYLRFKLALTENEPVVRPYDEALWAELPEAKTAAIDVSLSLLDALHRRWIACLRALPAEAFERRFVHPVSGPFTLNEQVAAYSWHGRHHVAHITSLRERMRW
jgi:hypothetical protein